MSTADFRNAFLKTIRQIIRESVRNMSIPSTKPGSGPGILLVTGHKAEGLSSHTLERPTARHTIVIAGGSHTLGKVKKSKPTQRHSAGNIDYDQLNQDGDENTRNFRRRSKTITDAPDTKTENEQGFKSEGEEDCQSFMKTRSLGKTPNHLTLSKTAVTLFNKRNSVESPPLLCNQNRPSSIPIQITVRSSPDSTFGPSSKKADKTFVEAGFSACAKQKCLCQRELPVPRNPHIIQTLCREESPVPSSQHRNLSACNKQFTTRKPPRVN
ncbi:protein still life, isoforms C/SIF type 2-like [Coccinella septempunctata]|uniref:protein still life, isoforms C/SIF type 2-like n=1 Tax=Coccinella septempunctata TaxID=41139 RepID=UPI001D05F96E|nr:protein still life, isoforms C/SIF type 2-like [Coccinella septempunctata]